SAAPAAPPISATSTPVPISRPGRRSSTRPSVFTAEAPREPRKSRPRRKRVVNLSPLPPPRSGEGELFSRVSSVVATAPLAKRSAGPESRLPSPLRGGAGGEVNPRLSLPNRRGERAHGARQTLGSRGGSSRAARRWARRRDQR